MKDLHEITIGVVVPTIGKSPSLPHLIGDLASNDYVDRIAIVDQSDSSEVRDISGSFPSSKLDYVDDQSARGASRARNLGARVLGPVDVLVFLDDDCRIAESSLLAGVSELEKGYQAITGHVVSSYMRVAFKGSGVDLNFRSVWTHAMEPAMIFDGPAFQALNGFDEDLGIGCPTVYQSGEGNDILIRLMKAGGRARYAPEFLVEEHGNVPSGEAYRLKALGYARGTGRVYAIHYPWWISVRVLVGPLVRAVGAACRMKWGSLLLHCSVFLGRCQGLLSVFPRRKMRARS